MAAATLAILGGIAFKDQMSNFTSDLSGAGDLANKVLMMIGNKDAERLHKVHFALDSDNLNPEQMRYLAATARFINATPGISVQVWGCTDKSGSQNGNQDLRNRRAAAIFNALTEDFGVNPQQIGIAPTVPESARLQHKKYGTRTSARALYGRHSNQSKSLPCAAGRKQQVGQHVMINPSD